jgi:hypothetical protein
MKKALIMVGLAGLLSAGCQTVDQRNQDLSGRDLPTKAVVSVEDFNRLDDGVDVRGLTKYELMLPTGETAFYMAGRTHGEHKTRLTTSQYLLDTVTATKPDWDALGIEVIQKYR